MTLRFFITSIFVLILNYSHNVLASVDNNASNQKSVGGEELAAMVNGYNISLSQVDENIRRQVSRIHADLNYTVKSTVTDVMHDYLVAESKEKNATTRKIRIKEVLRDHKKEVEQLVKNDDPQSQLLKERMAQQYLESTNRKEFAKTLHQLQQNNDLNIDIPLASQLESPLPQRLILANIDGIVIHAELLEKKAALKLYQLRGELYLLRKKALEKLIEQYLLQQESEKRGVTITKLANHKNNPEIEDQKIDEYIAQQKILGKVYTRAAVKPYLEYRMRYSLHEQFVMGLKDKANITYLLEKPELPRFLVNDKLGTKLSVHKNENSTEPSDIFYFSNYRCDQCRTTQQQIQKLVETHPDVTIKYFDFVPLTDLLALNAAILARCSGNQGKYNEMRSLLLNTPPLSIGDSWFKAEQLNKFIRRNNIKKGVFNKCLNNVNIQKQVAMETEEALRVGFRDPPAFVVSGKPLSGLQTAQDLISYVENQPAQ